MKKHFIHLLISKKRYVADKYEDMQIVVNGTLWSIVLKARDNAPIVKHVFGNVIEKIMIDKDLDKTANGLKQTWRLTREDKFSMRDTFITKSLVDIIRIHKG